MLDAVLVFKKSGVVLWRQVWETLKGNPVDNVIHSVLLEDREMTNATEPEYIRVREHDKEDELSGEVSALGRVRRM